MPDSQAQAEEVGLLLRERAVQHDGGARGKRHSGDDEHRRLAVHKIVLPRVDEAGLHDEKHGRRHDQHADGVRQGIRGLCQLARDVVLDLLVPDPVDLAGHVGEAPHLARLGRGASVGVDERWWCG